MKGPRSRGSCLSACAALAMISAVLAPHAVASPGAPALRMAAIDRYIESEMRAQQIPGLSLALFRNGVPVYVKGFGVATLEHAVPAQPRTVYQLGSIGKQFTAAAIMLLADEHRLDLDAPLARYLPEAPASWAGVTVRRMLNHQSGIAQLSDASHHLLDLRRDYSDGQLIRLAASQPLEFAPQRLNFVSPNDKAKTRIRGPNGADGTQSPSGASASVPPPNADFPDDQGPLRRADAADFGPREQEKPGGLPASVARIGR